MVASRRVRIRGSSWGSAIRGRPLYTQILRRARPYESKNDMQKIVSAFVIALVLVAPVFVYG
jgi:hypothetical protein